MRGERITRMAKDTDLQTWLKSWAEWAEREGPGFSSATVIYHHSMNQFQGGFGSRIPTGVIPPRSLEKIVLAMNMASENRHKVKYITAMQHYYLYGFPLAAYKLDKPIRILRRWKTRGEDILRRQLKA